MNYPNPIAHNRKGVDCVAGIYKKKVVRLHVGWFKFHRQIFDNPICTKDAEYFFVWVYILNEAKFEETRDLFKNEEIILAKGQLLTTVKDISTELNINESKVNRILKKLEIEKQIERRASNKKTLITVLNWEKYQSDEKQNEKQVKNERQTNDNQMENNRQTSEEQMKNERQTSGKPSYYNKEIKKERIEEEKEDEEGKNEKKDTHLSERKRIIEYLNQKLGTRYRHGSDINKKHINARLNEGYTVDDFYEVIDKKCGEWQGTEREKYLRPETLFGNKFESYLNQKIVKEQKQGERDILNEWRNS